MPDTSDISNLDPYKTLSYNKSTKEWFIGIVGPISKIKEIDTRIINIHSKRAPEHIPAFSKSIREKTNDLETYVTDLTKTLDPDLEVFQANYLTTFFPERIQDIYTALAPEEEDPKSSEWTAYWLALLMNRRPSKDVLQDVLSDMDRLLIKNKPVFNFYEDEELNRDIQKEIRLNNQIDEESPKIDYSEARRNVEAEERKSVTAEKTGALSIGDLGFNIPPTAMHFSWINQSAAIPTLRTEGDAIISHNNHVPRVNLTLYFNGEDEINNSLRPLVAMFKYMPFSTIRNTTIFDAWVSRKSLNSSENVDADNIDRFGPLSCYLENITFNSVPGFPGSIQASLSITCLNKLPYNFSSRMYTSWEDAKMAAIEEARFYALDSSIISSGLEENASVVDMVDSVGQKTKIKTTHSKDMQMLPLHDKADSGTYRTTIYPNLSEPFKKQYKYRLIEEELPEDKGKKTQLENGVTYWPKYKNTDNESLYLIYNAPKKFETPQTIFAERLSVVNDASKRVNQLVRLIEKNDPTLNPELEKLGKGFDETVFKQMKPSDLLNSYITFLKNMYDLTEVDRIVNTLFNKLMEEWVKSISETTEEITLNEIVIFNEEGGTSTINIGEYKLDGDLKKYDPETGAIINPLAEALDLLYEEQVRAPLAEVSKVDQDKEIIKYSEAFFKGLLGTFKYDPPDELFASENPSSPLNYNKVAIELGWDNKLELTKDPVVTLSELVTTNTHKRFDGNIIGYHAPSVIDSISYSFSNNSIPNFLNSSNLPVYQHLGIPSASASIILRTREERLHKLINDMSTSTQEIGAQLMAGNYKLAPFGTIGLSGNLKGNKLETGAFSGNLLNAVGFNSVNIRNVSSRNIEGHPGWWEVSIDLIENTQNIRLLESLHNASSMVDLPVNIDMLVQNFFPACLTSAPNIRKQKEETWKDYILDKNEDIIISLPPYINESNNNDTASINKITIDLYGIPDVAEKKKKKEFLLKSIDPVISYIDDLLSSMRDWELKKRNETVEEGATSFDEQFPKKFSITETYAAFAKEFLYQLIYVLRDIQLNQISQDKKVLSQKDLDFAFPTAEERKIIDFSKNKLYIQALIVNSIAKGKAYDLLRRQDFRMFLDDVGNNIIVIQEKLNKLEDKLITTGSKTFEIQRKDNLTQEEKTKQLNELHKKYNELETRIEDLKALPPESINNNSSSWQDIIKRINKSVNSNFPDLGLYSATVEGTGHRYISPYFPFVGDDLKLEIIEMHEQLTGLKIQTLLPLAALRSEKFRENYFKLLSRMYPEGTLTPANVEDESFFNNVRNQLDNSFDRGLLSKLQEDYKINLSHKLSAFEKDGNLSIANAHQDAVKFSDKYQRATLNNEKLMSNVAKEDLMKLMASTAIMEFLTTLITANIHAANTHPQIIEAKKEYEQAKRKLRDIKKSLSSSLTPEDRHYILIELEEDLEMKKGNLMELSNSLITAGGFALFDSKSTNKAMTSYLASGDHEREKAKRDAASQLIITEDTDRGTFLQENYMDLLNQKLHQAKSINTLAERGNWQDFSEFLGIGNIESEVRKYELLQRFDTSLTQKRKGSMSRAFPTFKLFFIEEDSNTWHAFDDFYSYDAVHEISIVESKHAASKTALIKLSNVTGNLLNAEWESLFSEANQWGTIPNEAMRIKPGAQLMLLVGYGADYRHLSMKFRGAVTEIKPGPIIEITAQSWGAGLLNKVGSTSTTSYTSLYGATSLGSALFDILAQTPGLGKLGRWEMRDANMNDPSKIAGTTFKNIYYARALNGLLGTFGDIIPVETNIQSIIGDFVFSKEESGLPFSMTAAAEKYRHRDTVISLIGNSLYDNVLINTSERDGYGFWNFMDNAFDSIKNIVKGDWGTVGFQWHVTRQSAWDALHEITLFLGDYIVTTLPFDEGADLFSKIPRETLYFGPRDGFYKAKSSAPEANISLFIDKIIDDIGQIDGLLSTLKTKCAVRHQNTIGADDSDFFLENARVYKTAIADAFDPPEGSSAEKKNIAKIANSIISIGKRLLANSLHTNASTIKPNEVFTVDTSAITSADVSKSFYNFKENLLLNGFHRTLKNVNKYVLPKGESNSSPKKLPEIYKENTGVQKINMAEGAAAGAAGVAAFLFFSSNPIGWGTALAGGATIALSAGVAYWISDSFVEDYLNPDGDLELITPNMSQSVIHEILLNDFDKEFYPSTFDSGFVYNVKDQQTIKKLQKGDIPRQDIIKYNMAFSDFQQVHSEQSKSALHFILAAPGGVSSSPPMARTNPLFSFGEPEDTRGDEVFGALYQTYFSKQDIVILLDTVDYLKNYYKEKQEGLLNRAYGTQPRSFVLDDVFLELFGDSQGGLKRLTERPVVQQHSVNNYEDIIDNSIIATSDQMYNHVELLYPNEPDPENSPNNTENRAFVYYSYDQDPDFLRSYQSYQKNLDPNIFIDKAAANAYTSSGDDKVTKEVQEAMKLTPHRVANQILMNVMKPMYQGTLTILGNPHIRPWDIIHVHDDMTEMYGPIEVEQVVTTISPSSGYTTTIIPNAVIHHNNVASSLDRNTLQLSSQISSLATIWSTMKWALTGGAIILGWKFLKGRGTKSLKKINEKIGDIDDIFKKAADKYAAGSMAARATTSKSFFEELTQKQKKILEKQLDSSEIAALENVLQVNNEISNITSHFENIKIRINVNNPGTSINKNIKLDKAASLLDNFLEQTKGPKLGNTSKQWYKNLQAQKDALDQLTKERAALVDKFDKTPKNHTNIRVSLKKEVKEIDQLRKNILTKDNYNLLQKDINKVTKDLKIITTELEKIPDKKVLQRELTKANSNLQKLEKAVGSKPKKKADKVKLKNARNKVKSLESEIKNNTQQRNALTRQQTTLNNKVERLKIVKNANPTSTIASTTIDTYKKQIAKLEKEINNPKSKLSSKKIKTKKDQIANLKKKLRAGRAKPSVRTTLAKQQKIAAKAQNKASDAALKTLKKRATTAMFSSRTMFSFGLKALNWIGYASLIYDTGSWLWELYETSAKTSILQANLMAGANQLTLIPLEHPAGKDYTAGLEGIIGTSGASSQILYGFTSGASSTREIRIQDIMMQNMEFLK